MNESAAREVLLVRAVELADGADATLSASDRGHAARAAAELVRWQAADQGRRATAEEFLARRAQLLAAKLAERSPTAWHALRAFQWRPWIGIALPLAAFAIGAAMEHIADRRHVNILAFPLLGLVAWNLAVYLWLAVHGLNGLLTGSRASTGWLHRTLAGARGELDVHSAGALAGAFARFGLDWLERSAPLVTARAGRVLHLSAAMLALGALAGLFVRGLAFEYRAGWESTFLDAATVHAILSFVLGPAEKLSGVALPGVAELATLRWGDGATGENAGRWIYLYTATVALAVIGPRLLLTAIARMREQGLAARFPLPLDEPYFRRVLAGWRESPAQVRVVPYAYTPGEAASEGLQRLAMHLLGDDARVYLARPVAFGEEDAPAPAADARAQDPDLVVALFNLASTPETENHGVFLDHLAPLARGRLAVIVDESPYRRRLGAQAGADERIAQRRQAWTGLAATRDLHALFVDLESPDLVAAARELDEPLAKAKASG
ncbi:MAG: DUF2868 domain-containing protein [Gammaproteobacteria bacterium]|nr:MAG: DUF2868 domain-containing protein [Gammaproteobacteria bacterium]